MNKHKPKEIEKTKETDEIITVHRKLTAKEQEIIRKIIEEQEAENE